jgi:hypothetical protein
VRYDARQNTSSRPSDIINQALGIADLEVSAAAHRHEIPGSTREISAAPLLGAEMVRHLEPRKTKPATPARPIKLVGPPDVIATISAARPIRDVTLAGLIHLNGLADSELQATLAQSPNSGNPKTRSETSFRPSAEFQEVFAELSERTGVRPYPLLLAAAYAGASLPEEHRTHLLQRFGQRQTSLSNPEEIPTTQALDERTNGAGL